MTHQISLNAPLNHIYEPRRWKICICPDRPIWTGYSPDLNVSSARSFLALPLNFLGQANTSLPYGYCFMLIQIQILHFASGFDPTEPGLRPLSNLSWRYQQRSEGPNPWLPIENYFQITWQKWPSIWGLLLVSFFASWFGSNDLKAHHKRGVHYKSLHLMLDGNVYLN